MVDATAGVQHLNQPRKVGDNRVMQPVDLAVGPVDELGEVHSRRTLDRSENEAAYEEGYGLAFSVLEFPALVRQAVWVGVWYLRGRFAGV